MAASDGGGLRRLFEKPLSENPTLLEALSSARRNHRIAHPIDRASFTEIFGELHFQEKSDHRVAPPVPGPPPVLPTPTRTTSWADDATEAAGKNEDHSSLDALLKPKPASTEKRSGSFCTKKNSSSASSLLLCTEGLGSESTVDADDVLKDGDAAPVGEEVAGAGRTAGVEEGKTESEEKRPPPSFPPPIRSLGRGGKPCVCFRSVRGYGRFVLTEVVIPGNELLHAYREGGRLRLQFAAGAGADDDEEMHMHGRGGDKGRRAGNASQPRANQNAMA